jgi:hypothetical protein
MSGVLLGGCMPNRGESPSFRSLGQLVDALNESVQHNDAASYVACFDVSASVSPLLGDAEAKEYRYDKMGRELEERLARDFRESYLLDVNNRRESGFFHASKNHESHYAVVTYTMSLRSNSAEITSINAHLTNTGWHLLLDEGWCREALENIVVRENR